MHHTLGYVRLFPCSESGESDAPSSSLLVQPVFQGRNPAGSLSTDSVSSLVDVEQLSTVEEVAKSLIEFLVTRSEPRRRRRSEKDMRRLKEAQTTRGVSASSVAVGRKFHAFECIWQCNAEV